MDLTNYQEYQDYFEALATSHVDIASFLFGDQDVIINESKSNLTLRVLWLTPYDPVQVIDELSDNEIGSVGGALFVFGQAATDSFEDRQTEYKACEGIVKDIISRLKKDYQEGTILTRGLGGYRYGEAEQIRGATRLTGCRLDFTFMRPERLVYNELKWQ